MLIETGYSCLLFIAIMNVFRISSAYRCSSGVQCCSIMEDREPAALPAVIRKVYMR